MIRDQEEFENLSHSDLYMFDNSEKATCNARSYRKVCRKVPEKCPEVKSCSKKKDTILEFCDGFHKNRLLGSFSSFRLDKR